MKQRTVVRLLWGLVTVVAIGLLAGSYAISRYYLTFSRHKAYDRVPSDFQMSYHEARFPSRIDRVNLHGWFIPAQQGRGDSALHDATVILVHGHHSNMGKVGAMSLLEHVARPLHDAGFSLLLLDLRNHGRSDDLTPVSLGFWEQDDVLGAIDYLRANHQALAINPTRTGLYGVSMGGATVIYAAAADHHSKSPHVQAVFVESAFARTRDPIELKLGVDGVPDVLQKLLFFWFSTIPEKDILQNNPLEHIRQINAPLYFVHSQVDAEVRPEDSREMYTRALQENPQHPAQLWISEGTGHASTPREFAEEYRRRLVEFFGTHL